MSAYFESLNRRMRVTPVAPEPKPAPQRAAVELVPMAPDAAPPVETRTPTHPLRLRHLTPGEIPRGYAALAERLLVRANGTTLRTLVFAGCGGGEGSTSVALEFAESLAGSGMSVLLIDADLRTSGLTSGIAADGADLIEVVNTRQSPAPTPWGRGKLTIVPSPRERHTDKDRFFRSREFAAWLEMQKGAHDYVLLDAPPLLHFADGTLMARASDGVVVVIRSETTDREALIKARDQLGKAGVNVVGVVLNRARNPIPPFLRPYVSME